MASSCCPYCYKEDIDMVMAWIDEEKRPIVLRCHKKCYETSKY